MTSAPAPALTPRRRANRYDPSKLSDEQLDLIHKMVRGVYMRPSYHCTKEDLMTAAWIGLAEARRNWNPELSNVPFDIYAVAIMRFRVRDELRNQIYFSRNVSGKIGTIIKLWSMMGHRLGRTPTMHDIRPEFEKIYGKTDNIKFDAFWRSAFVPHPSIEDLIMGASKASGGHDQKEE